MFVGLPVEEEDGTFSRNLVLLNDREGQMLHNRFKCANIPGQPFGQFYDVGEEWYKEANWEDDTRTISFEGGDVNVKVLQYVRSMIWQTGRLFTPFIQEAEDRIIPVSAFKEHLPAETIARKISRARLEVALNPNPDQRTLEKLKALVSVIYQMTGEISLKRKETEIKPLFYSNDFLNLFNDEEDKYTIPKFREIMGNHLAPKDGDPMNDPTHILYDFNLVDDWMKFINRHTVSRNAEGDLDLRLNDGTDKEFYNAWLTLIQNDILRGGTRFIDYARLLFKIDPATGHPDLTQPKRFSLGTYFTVDERATSDTNDIALVEAIDEAMTGIFGHTGYALIFSGLMSFNEDDSSPNGIRVDSLLFSMRQLERLFRRFGIKALSSRLGDLIRYSRDHMERKVITIGVLSSLFLTGLSHIVKCIKITESGQQELFGTAIRVAAPSTEGGVLNDYFLRYEPSYSESYARAANLFINREYKKYSSDINLKKENTFGRGKLEEKVYEQIDIELKRIFVDTIEWQQFEQFQDNPALWHLWTGIMLKSIVSRSIDFPTDAMDSKFVGEIRNAIMNQRDAHIEIKIERGGRGRLQAYASNALIHRGITITIPYSELMTIINDIYFTLVFGFDDRWEKHKQLGYMSPSGYELAFGMHWTGELQGKVMKAYNTLWQMFKLEEYGPNEEYKAYFYVGSGGGFSLKRRLHVSYARLGFESPNSFPFKPGNDMELHKAIQSILFYTFSLPDVFCVIKTGTHTNDDTFLVSNIFSTFSTVDVMSSSGVGDTFSLNPYWDESVRAAVFHYLEQNPYATIEELLDYFPEEYHLNVRVARLQYELGKIFSPTDIRFFLGFHDMGTNTHDNPTQKRMLAYIYQAYFKKLFEIMVEQMGEEAAYLYVNLFDLTIDDYLSREIRLNPFPPLEYL